LFDPSIRTSLEQLGYDRTFTAIADDSITAPDTVPAPGLSGLEVSGSMARIADGWSIDLGGIGKGLAADVVADELIAAGANSAYISLGGDIRASGEPVDADGWNVPLIHPLTEQPFAHHTLFAGALVMSTTALRRWRRGGVDLHHLIDPRTGRPAETDLLAVAVADQTAARGEALAKSAIVAGRSVGSALLRSAGVKAWLLSADGVEIIEGADA
jgi:thiamine biosynthesis lipoprotein